MFFMSVLCWSLIFHSVENSCKLVDGSALYYRVSSVGALLYPALTFDIAQQSCPTPDCVVGLTPESRRAVMLFPQSLFLDQLRQLPVGSSWWCLTLKMPNSGPLSCGQSRPAVLCAERRPPLPSWWTTRLSAELLPQIRLLTMDKSHGVTLLLYGFLRAGHHRNAFFFSVKVIASR